MEQRVLFKRDYNVDDNNDYLLVKEFLICGDYDHKELVLKLKEQGYILGIRRRRHSSEADFT